MVKQWRFYHKHAITEMRPYIEGEDLTGISVSDGDEPKEGGMIARNPQDHNDQWYIAPEYFNDNYIKTTQAGVQEKRRSTELLAALGRVMFGYLQELHQGKDYVCPVCGAGPKENIPNVSGSALSKPYPPGTRYGLIKKRNII